MKPYRLIPGLSFAAIAAGLSDAQECQVTFSNPPEPPPRQLSRNELKALRLQDKLRRKAERRAAKRERLA
jgi:hypothetical protein